MGWLRPVSQPPPVAGDLALAVLVTAIIEVASGWTLGHGPMGASLDATTRALLALPGLSLALQRRSARLFISPAMARTHVSRAMSKLEARDRAQLVVFAYETRLVSPGRLPATQAG